MKVDWLRFLLLMAVAALLSWGGYELCDGEPQSWAMAGTVFVTFAVGSILLCMDVASQGHGTNVRALALAYLAVSLVMNFVYTFFEFSAAGLFVPNGILLLLFLLMARAVLKTDV